ncbi:amidase [Curtobacterium pusillum]|uniref:amidase n=1 Tax=Curtobacterium pusillum TaxID=69373 RepID=UPI001C92C437|nr:amidase [Curtobacterium pusillum]
MNDLHRPIAELAAMLRDGTTTAAALVDQSLDRIDAVADLAAFVHVDHDGARAAAARADEDLAAGQDRGPLHGLPVAVKDNIDVAGQHTRAGSLLLGDEPATRDATVVRRLRDAGAVIVGRTNMHELAWGGTTDNPHTGRARNPWNRDRVPAGSSGGSGIAVAAGTVVAALGTDTGGSVRLPASVNGVSGLRPTIGRVSNAGVVPLAWTMDTVGPLARTAADAAVVHDAIAGWDPRDRTTRRKPTHPSAPRLQSGDPTTQVRGLRVGVIADYALVGNQPDVTDAVRSALDALAAAGAEIVEIAVPGVDELVDAQLVVDAVEPSAMHLDLLRTRPQDYGDDVRTHLEIGLRYSGVEYVQAQRFRAWFRDGLLDAMRDVDVLVTPTMPFTALPHGAESVELDGRAASLTAGNMRYTAIGSMAGFPGLSVPVGLDRDGLPIGMLFTGRAFDETTVVRAGHGFQGITEHHLLRPPLH